MSDPRNLSRGAVSQSRAGSIACGSSTVAADRVKCSSAPAGIAHTTLWSVSMPPPWHVFLKRHSRERQLLWPSPGRASRCVTFGHEFGVRNTAALSPHR
eukprot:9701149-Ditylum_brightwellii.AAC.1